MEEKIRLAVFGQKRLSREGGIKSILPLKNILKKSPNSKLIGYSLSTHIIPSWTHFSIQKLPKQLKRRSALILK